MQEALAKSCKIPTAWVEVEDVDLHVEKQMSGVLYNDSDVVVSFMVYLQVCLVTSSPVGAISCGDYRSTP